MCQRKLVKQLIIVMLIVYAVTFASNLFCSWSYASTELVNSSNQYMELMVSSIDEIPGQGTQVVMEWWSYNLNFKGLDLRFSYDSSSIVPSDIYDNSILTDANGASSFKFNNDFIGYMDLFTIGVEDGEYRCVMSLENYDLTCKYVENNEDLGYVVNTNVDGGVLIGKMSFRLLDGKEINNDTFSLKTGSKSPITGIKIDQTSSTCYTDPSVFRFTVLSDDANLASIKYDFFNYQEDEDGNPIDPIYDLKQVDLEDVDLSSDDENSIYKIDLLDNFEKIYLKLQKSNANSTIEINGVENDLKKDIILDLNDMGEEDTVIEIKVTAQDGNSNHTYKLIIHRPYVHIKGLVKTLPTDSTTGTYDVYVNVFKSDDVSTIIDWHSLSSFVDVHDDLLTLDYVQQKTNPDGTYDVYVVPGKYDIMLDRPGYLSHYYVERELNEGDELDLGEYSLLAGDVNSDGSIELEDMSSIIVTYGINDTDMNYKANLDVNDDGSIELSDLTEIIINYDTQGKFEL